MTPAERTARTIALCWYVRAREAAQHGGRGPCKLCKWITADAVRRVRRGWRST